MKILKKILCTFLIVVMCLTSAPLQGFIGIDLPDSSIKANAAKYSLYWPVPTSVASIGKYSSAFGLRKSPKAGASTNHRGIDISGPSGTAIYAAYDGVVVSVSSSNARGNYVLLYHESIGLSTLYQHLSCATVQRGDEVIGGSQIGLMGSTGVSTGPHLHYGVLVGKATKIDHDLAKYNMAINPLSSDISYTSSSGKIVSSDNPDDYSYPTRDLYYTSPVKTGSDVMWVQAVLWRLGYSISIDGSYGPATRDVVKLFQADYGLTVDGSCGLATRSKLAEEWNKTKNGNINIVLHSWLSNEDFGDVPDEFLARDQVYLCYELVDSNTLKKINSLVNKSYSVTLTLYNPSGAVASSQTFSKDDSDSISCTMVQAGTYRGVISVQGDINGTSNFDFNVSYDADMVSSVDSVSLNLNGTNTSTFTVTPTMSYPENWGMRADFDNTVVQVTDSYTSNGSMYVHLKGLKEGKTNFKLTLFEKYTGYNTEVTTLTIPITVAANKYTISYNANGGSGAPSSQTKSHGTDLVLSSTKPTGKSYTVSFNGNGGSVSTSSQTYTQSFVGWNTNSSGTGSTYSSGGIYSNNASATLYAMWSNPKLSVSNPTRSGYHFLGWYDSTATDDYGTPIGKKYTSNTSITSNVTLYAMWSTTSTVLFGDYNLDGEIDFMNDITAFNSHRINGTTDHEILFRGDVDADGDLDFDDITYMNSVRNGEIAYTSLPAYQKLSGLMIYSEPKTSYEYGESFDISGLEVFVYYMSTGTYYFFDKNLEVTGYDPYKIGSQTLTVNYYQYSDTFTVTVKAPKYTLQYNANGGSVSETAKTVTYGQSIGTLPTPTRADYTFLGWSFSENGTSYVTSSTTYSYLSNKTLYAQWKANPKYTLSYNANGGTGVPAEQTGATNYTINEFVPERLGYTFLGWYTSSSATSATYTPSSKITLTSNTTLYAVWKSSTTISTNTSYSATVNFANQEIYYAFTPSSTGKYTIESTGSLDSKVYVYNTSGDALGQNDDGSNEGNNFKLTINLTSGTKYYVKVRAYSGNTGSTSFKITPEYTISYNANGGSGAPGEQTKVYGVTLTLSSTIPTRTGYTFLGWSTSSTATSASYQAGGSFTTNANTTLYAVWSKNDTSVPTAYLEATNNLSSSQTVTINMYDDEGVFAYYWGTSPTYANNEYQECSFISTSIKTERVVDKAGTYYLTVIDASGNVGGNYSITFYKTTLNANGGSVSVSSILSRIGSLITLPTPTTTQTGYSYAGWSTSSSATSGTTAISTTSNTTYYAVWKANTYTVKYNANGGSGSMSNSSHTYDVSKALTSNVFTRTGYTFLGWSTSSSATSATYTDSQSVKNLTSTNGATVNLYAVWSKTPTYTITFNANGGSGAPSSQTKVKDVTLTLSSAKPTRTGYIFLGWSTSSVATSATYQPSGNFTTNADTTLYAVWKANTYSVKYNANGGSGTMSNSSHTYDVSKALTSNTFTRTGYTFLGWSTSNNATSATYTDSQSVKNLTSTDGGTVNLYAVWQINDTNMTANASYSATISTGGDIQYFTFTPSKSGTYVIYSTGDKDTVVTLYNSSDSKLKEDDDGGDSSNFRLQYDLTAGTTYRFGVKYYSSGITGTISFKFGEVYSIKYNANGGSNPPETQYKDYGASLVLDSSVPTKTGYTFQGWSTSSSATSATYSAGGSFTTNANTTLYAVWKANTYTVKYNANGGSGSMSNSSHTYDVSKALTANAFTRSGYSFLGWSTSSSATSATYTDCQTVKNLTSTDGGTVNLYAVWSKTPTYTITYNANGGSGAPSNQTKAKDVTLTLSSTKPTRTGYTFLGWSTSSSATSATYLAGGSFTTNANTYLYAVWKANTYTVKYNANGGSGSMSNYSHTYDVSKALATNFFTRTGYTFLGWSTSSSDTSVTYTQNQLVENLTSTDGAIINLYAVWKANTYTVKYNANGGSGSMSDSIHTYGTAITLTANAFTRTSYTFLGWSTSSSATSAAYTDGQSVKNLTSTNGAIINLYAVWKANTYTVKYNANGGSGSMSNSSHTYDVSKALDSNTFTRTGYTFLGWSTSSSATSATYTDGQSVKNLTSTDEAIINLYAVWKANLYIIKYNANGGSGSMYDSVHTYDVSKALDSNTFTRTGYTFLGWSTSSSATSATYTDGQSVKNITSTYGDIVNLYAVWSKNVSYTLYYNANGGSGAPENQTGSSSYIISSIVPTKGGYTFLGWSINRSDASASYLPNDYITIRGSTILYAIWKANTYTIKYNANGGSGSMADSNHTYGVSKALNANTFTRSGYTFLGWSPNSSATVATYTDSQFVEDLAFTNGAIVNLYAVWHKHSYTSKITTAATCTTSGIRTYTCSGCSNSYTETISATGHNWTAATCTSKKICSVCKSTSGEPLGHSYTSKVTKAATCTTSGTKSFTCSKCSNSYTETIPATGHSWTAATCTTKRTCSVCGKTDGSILGHSYSSNVTKPATCISTGTMIFACSKCSDSYTETIPVTEHNYISIVIQPTCSSGGYAIHKCSVCESSYNDSFVDKLNHNMNNWYILTPASCDSSGLERIDCLNCDYYETREIPATGHDFSGSVCKDCNFDKAESCSCNCHKSGIISKIIWKIINFFNKFLRRNQVCFCGIYHY